METVAVVAACASAGAAMVSTCNSVLKDRRKRKAEKKLLQNSQTTPLEAPTRELYHYCRGQGGFRYYADDGFEIYGRGTGDLSIGYTRVTQTVGHGPGLSPRSQQRQGIDSRHVHEALGSVIQQGTLPYQDHLGGQPNGYHEMEQGVAIYRSNGQNRW
ncbi:hypothetical protein EG329_011851 [Mollisiaceae sp. DMI_Dod_QoI]|nr:hypothetical protein EG329_011851 [Helotiales sp. DMI_Dod_QoI]